MRITRDTLLGLLIDPVRFEEILGDLEESRAGRSPWALRRDLLSVCLRQSRLRTVPRELALPVLAAISALVLLANPVPTRTISARDDAGPFTVHFLGRDIIGATVDGVVVPRDQIRHSGDLVIIPALPMPLRLRVVGPSSFEWESRSPRGIVK